MMQVHHAGDAIEAETVEHIGVHPESEIRQKETQNFVTSVVEQTRVPKFVSPSSAFMEVQMVGTVKFVDTVSELDSRS